MEWVSGSLLSTVQSVEQRRFEYVTEQGWDASCGYAALAALLGRYRGLSVSEADLLALSGARGDVTRVSLAELARLAQSYGFEVRPWRCTWGDLGSVAARSAPLLIHYDRPTPHFALLLALAPQGVVAADPARGLELLTREQFLGRWSGVVLEILDPVQPGLGATEVEKAVNSALGRARVIERALASRP